MQNERPAAPQPTLGERFFEWIRSLGIVRSGGWIGGVCEALAVKVGIDPIIVRGIFIAGFLLGAPMLAIYALAWLLLPDRVGTIPAERMLAGKFTAPSVVALVVLVFGSIPVVPLLFDLTVRPILTYTGIYGYGDAYYAEAYYADGYSAYGIVGLNLFDLMRIIGVLVLIVLSVVAVIVIAKRPAAQTQSEQARPAPPMWQQATTPAPDAPTDDASYGAWRKNQEEWQEQSEEWRIANLNAQRHVREIATIEAETRARELAESAAEARRIRRAERPRTGVGFVVTATGIALVAGSIAALLMPQAEIGLRFATAAAVCAVVGAVGMIVAGIVRRRSGLLAFLTIVALFGAVTTGLPYALGGTSVLYTTQGFISPQTSGVDQSVAQVTGYTYIDLYNYIDVSPTIYGDVNLTKTTGETEIGLGPNVTLELTADLSAGQVFLQQQTIDGVSEPMRLEDVATVRSTTSADGVTTYELQLTNDVPESTLPSSERTVTIKQRDSVVIILQRDWSTEGN